MSVTAKASLDTVVNFCDTLTQKDVVVDFPEIINGLLIPNRKETVSKIGAAVDPTLTVIEKAVQAGVDFLIVHHGHSFRKIVTPLRGVELKMFRLLLENDVALYSSHLPLDIHEKIGHNILIANALGLQKSDVFLKHNDAYVGIVCDYNSTADVLDVAIRNLFRHARILHNGPPTIRKVGIVAGSADRFISWNELRAKQVDALITGEVKYPTFDIARNHGIHLYVCGHHDSETFGVAKLAELAAQQHKIQHVNLFEENCPL